MTTGAGFLGAVAAGSGEGSTWVQSGGGRRPRCPGMEGPYAAAPAPGKQRMSTASRSGGCAGSSTPPFTPRAAERRRPVMRETIAALFAAVQAPYEDDAELLNLVRRA